LSRDEHSFGIALGLSLGASQLIVDRHSPVECSTSLLPFQSAVFQVVVLSLVTENGDEPELGEACRVLMPGGELFLLGVNRRSWSGVALRQNPGVQQMSLPRVITRLNAQDMVVEHITGIGLFGRTRPKMESNRPSALALPFADLLLIRARHRTRPKMTRLQLKKYPAGVLPTAVAPGAIGTM
jgi:SAM-dependent methyltransferase